MLRFDRFRLDAADARLEDHTGPIRLNPKAFDVLRVLVERRGQLVSKSQLLDAVWPDTHVGDAVLKVCMSEIRRALGDSATQPRIIQTVHRRGYRFIADLTVEISSEPSRDVAAPAQGSAADKVTTESTPPPRVLVGREREIELLEERLSRALGGERQVVFVTGEPGAGKTALVEHFVARAAAREARLAVTLGQSLEHVGATEPYLPFLEAIGRLAAQEPAARALLRRYAPTWLAQLPWLIDEAEREKLARELLGATRERMLREMAAFVEAFAAELPLVLVLEDLHWSDPSTVDLLSMVANRREPARLLLIATHRPVELVLARHALRAVAHALAASRRSSEIALEHLDAGAIAEYLSARFPGSRFGAPVAKLLSERTGGNPLFIVTLVDDLLVRGAVSERGGAWEIARDLRNELSEAPDTLRRLIEQQLERLDAGDRKLLEAASLAGMEFSAAAAAAGAELGVDEAEERFERLAEAGPFLHAAGTVEWPDGTVAARYEFRHALYRETLLKGASSRRRADCHLRIAAALEEAYGARATELAATLAVHFAEGGDRGRAVFYRRCAAENALARQALVEAESHLDVGLSMLESLPPSDARDDEELLLQSALGGVRIATRGYAAPEVVSACTRALELASAARAGEPPFPVLQGLWSFYTVRGELDLALELAKRNADVAHARGDDLMRLVGHFGLWTTYMFRGELEPALRHLDAGEPLYGRVDPRAALAYGQDQKVGALAVRAIVLWHLGAVDRAVAFSREAVEHARALGHPMSVAFAISFAAWLRILRREPEACLIEADAAIAYASDQGLPHWLAGSLHSRGWALAELGDLDGGIAEMERGLALTVAIGGNLGRGPRSVDLAAALARAGRVPEARAIIDSAKTLLASTGERYHEAELHRLDAALMLAEAGGAEAAGRDAHARAERALARALECARRRRALSLELRAATDLVRICRSDAKARRAREQLARCVESFEEGGETADVRAARALLAG